MYSLVKTKNTGEKVFAVFSMMLTIVSLFLSPSNVVGQILSVLAVGLVAYPLISAIKTRDDHLVVLFVFMIGYVMIPFNYYWLGLHVNFYMECENEQTVYTTLQILCVFHSILLYCLKFSQNNEKEKRQFSDCNNTIYYLLVLFSIVFVTYGSIGKSIFETGGYVESIQVRESSAFFAYSVITISLAYIYSSTPTKRILTYLLVAYFCLKDLLMGNRVDSLELLLALFFIRLQYVWTRKTIVIAAIAGGLFMVAWGTLRADVNIGFVNALLDNVSNLGSRNAIIDYQTGNSAEVYYSSVRVIYMIDHGILTLSMRIQALLYFFISAIVPYSLLPEYANLSSYMQSTLWSGGGGLGPVFFYAFGGWFGVFVFSLFVAYSINIFQKKKASKFVHYYAILVLATTPRWYAYYPIQLIKFCLIGMILYIILNKMSPSKKSNKRIIARNNGSL